MTAELARIVAAQAKADEIARAVGETIEGGPLLRIAVTDPVTNTRLATCFVNYQPGPDRSLRLVGEAP